MDFTAQRSPFASFPEPLGLDNDKPGVSDFARSLLMADPRGRIEREFVLTGKDTCTIHGGILDVWVNYHEDPSFTALWVMYGGERRLVHRKEGRFGFTPFAKEHLLHPTGHAKDVKRRVYILGGEEDGKRIRREMRATMLVVWLDYASDSHLTRMWVQWKDGKRHLVHRKGL